MAHTGKRELGTHRGRASTVSDRAVGAAGEHEDFPRTVVSPGRGPVVHSRNSRGKSTSRHLWVWYRRKGEPDSEGQGARDAVEDTIELYVTDMAYRRNLVAEVTRW